MPTTKPPSPRITDRCLELVSTFPLRPIRSSVQHQQAKRVLRGLPGKQPADVADYRAVLIGLISDYERTGQYRIDASHFTAAQVVRHLLNERAMSVNAFAKAVGLPQSTLSEMLRGKRDWSKSAIIRISAFFGLNPGLFLR